MNPLIEKARQRKQQLEAEKARNEARDAEYAAAYEELEQRTFVVSMPGYEGTDSHLQIRADKLALNEMEEAEKNGFAAYREQVQHEQTKTTDQLLAEIRDSLERTDARAF